MVRFFVIIAAFASASIGYYFGNEYQYGKLESLSAVILKDAAQIEVSDELTLLGDTSNDTPDSWRLYLVVDTTTDQCRSTLSHFASVYNRLAANAKIQNSLSLVVLPYNEPSPEDIFAWIDQRRFVKALAGKVAALDTLAGDLGILPLGNRWCQDTQNTTALVDKNGYTRALIPFESPSVMGKNLSTIIDTLGN